MVYFHWESKILYHEAKIISPTPASGLTSRNIFYRESMKSLNHAFKGVFTWEKTVKATLPESCLTCSKRYVQKFETKNGDMNNNGSKTVILSQTL